MTEYTASCHREGEWLVVAVSDIEQVTQVRRPDEIEDAVRSLIELFTEDDPAEAEIEVRWT